MRTHRVDDLGFDWSYEGASSCVDKSSSSGAGSVSIAGSAGFNVSRGEWVLSASSAYYLDVNLAGAIYDVAVGHFNAASLVEYGAGLGCYTGLIR